MIVPSSTAKCSTWDLPLLLLYSKAKKRIGSLNSVLHNGSFDLKMTTWGIRRTIFIFKSQFVRVALYLLNGLRTLFFPSSRLQKLSSEAFILAVPSGLKRHSSSEQDTLVQLLGDWEEDERETRPTINDNNNNNNEDTRTKDRAQEKRIHTKHLRSSVLWCRGVVPSQEQEIH